MEKKLRELKERIREADAVLIGAGAGLSTAAGFIYSGERFDRYFGDFGRRYGFHDMYSGGFYPYEAPETFWARTRLPVLGKTRAGCLPALPAGAQKRLLAASKRGSRGSR